MKNSNKRLVLKELIQKVWGNVPSTDIADYLNYSENMEIWDKLKILSDNRSLLKTMGISFTQEQSLSKTNIWYELRWKDLEGRSILLIFDVSLKEWFQ